MQPPWYFSPFFILILAPGAKIQHFFKIFTTPKLLPTPALKCHILNWYNIKLWLLTFCVMCGPFLVTTTVHNCSVLCPQSNKMFSAKPLVYFSLCSSISITLFTLIPCTKRNVSFCGMWADRIIKKYKR